MALESNIDVLIIGAGPAGLMAALWMSRLGIATRIIDKRDAKVFVGQADGITPRTLEIFDSFGFANKVLGEGNPICETCLWNPGEDGRIRQVDQSNHFMPDSSPFGLWVLNQGRIERFIIDDLRKHSKLEVERCVLPSALELDKSKAEDTNAYPITIELSHLSEEEAKPAQINLNSVPDGIYRTNLGEDDTQDLIKKTSGREGSKEKIKAKYVIACDGSHSWTRQQLGFELEGDSMDYIWGVIDIIPITDFPDVRCHCIIQGPNNSGSLLLIPRENKLARFYVQLVEVKAGQDGRTDRSKITPETILDAAQRILYPYKLSYKYLEWWTAYQVGQRVCKSYSAETRIFLAGDAVHTHSPKEGQGMNISMQDSYNLGWKVALVAKGLAKRSILQTYEAERRAIAEELIALDHVYSSMFSGVPPKDAADQAGVPIEVLMSTMIKAMDFILGFSTDYGASAIVAKAATNGNGSETHPGNGLVSKQDLAKGIPVGKRLCSFKVIAQSDARPWHFCEHLKSDGRFRIVLFAGNVSDQGQRARVENFCSILNKENSFLHRFTPVHQSIDSVIQILTIHCAPRKDLTIFSFPEILRPFDEKLGWEYNSIFADEPAPWPQHGNAYNGYGVDREKGCVVVVRPDQYVGFIGKIEDADLLEGYFEGIFVSKASTNGI